MNGYRIITALPEHLPKLSQVERAAASIFPPGSIPDEIRQDAVPLEVLEAAQKAGRLWVAVPLRACGEKAGTKLGEIADNGFALPDPAGFCLLRVEDGIAVLAELDVAPAHMRRGLGRALIRQAAAGAAAEGFTCLYLTTFEHIPWNAPFYAGLGFRIVAGFDLPPCLQAALALELALGLRDRVAMCMDSSTITQFAQQYDLLNN